MLGTYHKCLYYNLFQQPWRTCPWMSSLHRYDIVFLPPSFPIVAMENPCLTFIISSILESQEFLLIDVIHEIAHGWFGNAVTNATWEEMWLSEGLATYAQRRITTEVYGTHTYKHAAQISPVYRNRTPLQSLVTGLIEQPFSKVAWTCFHRTNHTKNSVCINCMLINANHS